jgi:hypothetical protein
MKDGALDIINRTFSILPNYDSILVISYSEISSCSPLTKRTLEALNCADELSDED